MRVQYGRMTRMNAVNIYDMMEDKNRTRRMEDANKHYAEKAEAHFRHKPYANDFGKEVNTDGLH